MGQVTQLKSQWIVKVKVLGEISQKIAKVKVFEQNTNPQKKKKHHQQILPKKAT